MSQVEYETQNFNSLNNAIDDEHRKAINKIKIQKSFVFKRYMVYGSIFLLSISVLILSIGFIWWLLDERPQNLISNNEYITNNYELEKNINELEKIIERNKEFKENNAEIILSDGETVNQTIKEDYYLFRTVDMKLSSSKNIQISTGLIFNPNDTDFPERQYCYTEIKTNDGIKNRIDLSYKNGNQNIVNNDYNDAYQSLIQLDDFSKAKQYCKYRNF